MLLLVTTQYSEYNNLSITCREFRNLASGLIHITAQEQALPAVQARCVRVRIPQVDPQAVSLQLQILDDLWAEQAEEVRGSGELEARDDLLRDCCPTQHWPPLKHSDALARLGNVSSLHKGREKIEGSWKACIDLQQPGHCGLLQSQLHHSSHPALQQSSASCKPSAFLFCNVYGFPLRLPGGGVL